MMLSANQARIVIRRGLLACALAFLPLAVRAQDAPSAQNFVQANVQNALSILQDKSLAAGERRDRIHAFLLSLLDTHRIAIYTLGSAQATANPADLDAYSDAFRDFMVANYDSKLGNYAGQTLKVTSATQHAPGDFVVSALLVDPSGSANGRTPPEVDFRIVYDGGKFQIVDASIEGIWLALAERDDFQGFLKEHNGDINALTAHLKQMTASLEAQASN